MAFCFSYTEDVDLLCKVCKSHTPPVYRREAGQLISRSERWMMSLRRPKLQICGCKVYHFCTFTFNTILEDADCFRGSAVLNMKIYLASQFFWALPAKCCLECGLSESGQGFLPAALSTAAEQSPGGTPEWSPGKWTSVEKPVFSLKTTFGESCEVCQHWWRLTLADACADWLI